MRATSQGADLGIFACQKHQLKARWEVKQGSMPLAKSRHDPGIWHKETYQSPKWGRVPCGRASTNLKNTLEKQKAMSARVWSHLLPEVLWRRKAGKAQLKAGKSL